MPPHEKPIANSATLVQVLAEALQSELCDHQAFFVLVLDEHLGAMPCAEDLLKRPADERKRAAEVLRMWAARVEAGKAPQRAGS